ncbi:ABC transporter substrate-binding protein [Herbaspirillum sp. LeCh32-8]|uniref:ABC transporter substrate-binding protein n=1 Tax=Herbaspirillum sp. LeCh32-8 TaxID=2821356 RepID=UPI001AE8A18E|nr:ABC transporter substrate-binding protein [Herbaspirillum sp. LeCh32-8]MBP0597500.1 ABC transporter substrate-binding protein [Herbaspirillum sp. LeCh32-8]
MFGSNVHWLIVALLKKWRMRLSDVTLVNMTPVEAYAAFRRGDVDAWGMWDPWFAQAESQLTSRLLAPSRGVINNYYFLMATRVFAQKHAAVIRLIIDEFNKNGAWIKNNPDQVATHFSPYLGVSRKAMVTTVLRSSPTFYPISAQALENQQQIADSLFERGVIPHRLNINDWMLR